MTENENPGAGAGAAGELTTDASSSSNSPPLKSKDRRAPNETAAALISLLAERWPKCFSLYERNRKPLAIKIHERILVALDGAVTPAEVATTLRIYTADEFYLRASRVNAARIRLDGEQEGQVTTEQAEYARIKLMWRKHEAVGALHAGRWRAQTLAAMGLDERSALALINSKLPRRTTQRKIERRGRLVIERRKRRFSDSMMPSEKVPGSE
jgi:sRNA-binding protein